MSIDRLIAEAKVLAGGEHPCDILGHKWKQIGGQWCGCKGMEDGGCSVPVHECEACGDCDYGGSAISDEIRLECECVAELN